MAYYKDLKRKMTDFTTNPGYSYDVDNRSDDLAYTRALIVLADVSSK
jgi:hypothetical protein